MIFHFGQGLDSFIIRDESLVIFFSSHWYHRFSHHVLLHRKSARTQTRNKLHTQWHFIH
jgi:hypothetical protein